MRDRWALGGFVVGTSVFCALGFAIGLPVDGIAAVLALIVVVGLVVVGRAVVRHARLVRRLYATSEPARFDATGVRSADLGGGIFVAGLRRPTIFCDRRLPERLTPEQLRAVLLHERAHQRARDPARLLLLGLAAPVLERLPTGRQWLSVVLARREIAADREAIAHGATRADLAGALLALPARTSGLVPGFGSAVDLRLQVLLGDRTEVAPPAAFRRGGLLVAGVVTGVAVCSWLLHHHLVHVLGIACC